jgi:hypothetical protein
MLLASEIIGLEQARTISIRLVSEHQPGEFFFGQKRLIIAYATQRP